MSGFIPLEPRRRKGLPVAADDSTDESTVSATVPRTVFNSIAFEGQMSDGEVDSLWRKFAIEIQETKNIDESVEYSLERIEDGFRLVKISEDTRHEEFECVNGKARFGQPVDEVFLSIYLTSQTEAGRDVVVNHCGSVDAARTLARVAKDCGARVKFSDEVLSDLESKREGVISEIKTILGTDDISPVQKRTGLGR